jgi:hypothetical protein
MTAQTQKSIWTAVVLAFIGFVLWKTWPSIKHALSGGGSTGTGGSVGGTSAGNPYGYQQTPQQRSSSPSGGFQQQNRDQAPSGLSSNTFGNWLYNFTRDLTLNTPGPLSDPLYGSVAGYDSTALDNYTIPLQAVDTSSFDQLFSNYSTDYSGGGNTIDTSYDPSLDSYSFSPQDFYSDPGSLDLGSGDPGNFDPGSY